ncbi:protein cramped-like isoform X1 [Anguilla anguilla]|uniref:protein cramped-like isoform X1 n=2 Tax=Anguilla anguilla TaxID=7936 RepID=UPI0015B353EC|nr:protein cramped-like isoform X1 [Anguilla anguilla]
MVKRKKISSVPEEDENGMTTRLGAGSGDEGAKKLSRKLEGCDEEESGDQGKEERNTKTDGEEIPNPTPTGPSSSTPTLSTSASTLAGPRLDPQPQTLSTSVPQNQDQHHFLRSSVRPPSKRLRKDAIGSTINGHSNARGKGAENGAPGGVACGQSGAPAGSGGGGPKATLRTPGPAEKEEAAAAGSQKKARRQWESWSTEDKNTFFQGLYEHGKDFEAIQNNIALRYKKKGKPASMVKNKEQVRHFYYRTWHKISKYIDPANVYSRVLKKSSQELYGLICFAELRKKAGGLMDDKNAAKLNELIQYGVTTVRSKGRNLRIKAPMCRALKKLCDPDGVSDEEDQKPVRLPLKVPVELQPRSNHSWARVQSLAHNPRLRMVVELHRKVSSLIEFLKQKWAIQDQRIRKSLEEQEALESQERPPGGKRRGEELVLFPAESCTLTALPGVARVVHSKASCTVHWQESGRGRPGARDHPAAQILGLQGAPRVPGRQARAGAGETRRGDPAGAEGGTTDDAPAGGAEDKSGSSPSSLSTPLAPPPAGEGATEGAPTRPEGASGTGESAARDQGVGGAGVPAKEGPSPEPSLSPHKDPPSAGVSSSTNHCGAPSPGEPAPAAEAPPPAGCKDDAAPEPGGSEPRRGSAGGGAAGKEEVGGGGAGAGTGSRPAERIREEGWRSRGTENVTLAELYLMLGKPVKLQLEYEWVPVPPPDGPARPACSLPQHVLRCLLRLVSSEVNPKPVPELCSASTSPVKPSEEQSLTPPGKALAPGTRSPGYGRYNASVRGARLMSPGAGSSGIRNLPRSLLIPASDADGVLFTAPTALPPNSRHGKTFSPSREAERALRQQLASISKQSDIFLPKQRTVRSRHPRKPLVVQRTLLPRTTGDAPQHVCSFSIMSNSSATGTGSFWPIKPSLPSASRPLLPETSTAGPAPASQLSSAIDLAAKSAGIIPSGASRERAGPALTPETASPDPGGGRPLPQDPAEVAVSNGLPPPSLSGESEPFLSPPSVVSLLDISLPGPPEEEEEEGLAGGEPATHIGDSIIELASGPSGYGPETSLSHGKINGSDKSPEGSPARNWMAWPTQDPQWDPGDSTDSSLGSLLLSLMTPDKERRLALTPGGPPSSGTSLLGPGLLDGSSRDSFHARGLADAGEGDSQFACMMSDSSVDYIARFNDLAQELSVNEAPLPPAGHGGSG